MKLKSFFAVILSVFLIRCWLSASGTVNSFDSIDDWNISAVGGTKFNAKKVKKDGPLRLGDEARKDSIEISFDMAEPDLNSKDSFKGFVMELKNPSFSIKKDEALSLSYLWEGNENYLRIEIENDNGFGRMAEYTDLHTKDGWQELIVSNEDMENWGNKALKGEIGKVKRFKMVIFYSWDKGPGKVTFDELKVVKKPVRQVPVISVSQLGYRPADKKRVIVNVFTGEKKGYFRLLNIPAGDVVFDGNMKKSDFTDWAGNFLTGDFSEFKETGNFQIEVSFNKKLWHRSGVFKIEDNVFDENTARLDYEFITELRSDEKEIFGYPELGGYRDTGTMFARYLCTNTHMIYGLSTYILAQKKIRRANAVKIRYAIDELKYGVESMISWQQSDGSVLDAVKREPDLYPHNQYPDDNTYPWVKIRGDKNNVFTFTYPACMASASVALKDYDEKLSLKALEAAKRTYTYMHNENLPIQTAAAGNALWDCAEMYKATKELQYIKRARKLAEKILKNQFLDFTRTPDNICGNFSNSSRSMEFSYQYKLIHNVGMYFGLIELMKLTEKSDPLYTDIRFALKIFSENYLKTMSGLTPYMQIAEGLELNDDGTVSIMYFHPPTGPLGTQSHGLNCDHLAYALMGIRLAKVFNDNELLDFSSNQMQWIFGVNPLGISMMSGIGTNQALSMEKYLGLKAIPGGILNGIVGENGIRPYWARHWVSGEYWVPHNAYYTAVVGEIENAELADDNEADILVKLADAGSVKGKKDSSISLKIKNNISKDVKDTVVLRIRGSHYIEETMPVEISSGKSITIKKDIKSTGKRAPCYLSLIYKDKVVYEEIVLPKFEKFLSVSKEGLKKYKAVGVKASSEQKDENAVSAKNAIDGIPTTRWSSDFSDPQWISVDYGKTVNIAAIVMVWETAYGQSYEIQSSLDGKEWETRYSVEDEDGGKDEISFEKPFKARYIRMFGKKRGTQYGYSMFEIEAYGK
ncbi:MAG: discoidin domain-containing protein [Elusimicrobia bacterium]|nr:discoidin domain-containing protein [Elusimicrobiota bacterium]